MRSFLIVGDLNVDELNYLDHKIIRIGTDHEHIVGKKEMKLGGSAGITANALIHYANSSEVSIYATIGNDSTGKFLLDALDGRIDRSYLQITSDIGTGISRYFITPDGASVLFTELGGICHLPKKKINAGVFDVIHVSSLYCILKNSSFLARLIDDYRAKRRGTLVSINFNNSITSDKAQIEHFLTTTRPQLIFFNYNEFNAYLAYIDYSLNADQYLVVSHSRNGCLIVANTSIVAIKFFLGTIDTAYSIGAGDKMVASVLSEVKQACLDTAHLVEAIVNFNSNNRIGYTFNFNYQQKSFSDLKSAIGYIGES